eukprot:8730132-Lingulodinium_polyedra.AAC.1
MGGGHKAEAHAGEQVPVHMLHWATAPARVGQHSTALTVPLSGREAGHRCTQIILMTREIEAAPAGARTAWERHMDSCSIHTRQHVESLRAVA